MKILALALALLPAAAFAGGDIVARYGPLLEQCYGEAEENDARQLCIGVLSGTCIREDDAGNSTLGISQCNNSEAQVWDDLLNDEYRQTMGWAKAMDADEAENFPEFANRAKTLLAAQRAWIAFRDTECELEYALWGSGSMRNIAGSGCIMRLTARRTIELRSKREFMQ